MTGLLKSVAKDLVDHNNSSFLILTSVCFTIGAQMHTYSLSELVAGFLSPTHISHKST